MEFKILGKSNIAVALGHIEDLRVQIAMASAVSDITSGPKETQERRTAIGIEERRRHREFILKSSLLDRAKLLALTLLLSGSHERNGNRS